METENHSRWQRVTLYYIDVGRTAIEKGKADMMNDDCVITLPAEIILELLGGKPGSITVERNRETGEITIFAEND